MNKIFQKKLIKKFMTNRKMKNMNIKIVKKENIVTIIKKYLTNYNKCSLTL